MLGAASLTLRWPADQTSAIEYYADEKLKNLVRSFNLSGSLLDN